MRRSATWNGSNIKASRSGEFGRGPSAYGPLVLLPVDAAVRRYFDEVDEPIARHMEGDRAGVGLVYMDQQAGEHARDLLCVAKNSPFSRYTAASCRGCYASCHCLRS
ncbi:hypothetical protein [Nannocystis punicea]|uniref:Uncharacterized protein n=1 Tax=Nannocystis punicea TaxID=2995304 RepID=A0ABY7GYF0_9BACT|nr:hypothetical protein [Nannocystis poenicansa]WAS91915.1 hypothetical protein O0S08_37510 [Nannocystis poenicansa]